MSRFPRDPVKTKDSYTRAYSFDAPNDEFKLRGTWNPLADDKLVTGPLASDDHKQSKIGTEYQAGPSTGFSQSGQTAAQKKMGAFQVDGGKPTQHAFGRDRKSG
jgi:hypothetical protein